MPRLRAIVVTLVATIVAMLDLGASPASAADARSAQVVGVDGRTVDLLVYLDPSVTVESQSTLTSTVVIGGVEVPSEPKVADVEGRAREVVLALDVSGSMRGDRIKAARTAAQDYVKALPPDVKVGLVTFNDNVKTVLKPTADRAASRARNRSLSMARSNTITTSSTNPSAKLST